MAGSGRALASSGALGQQVGRQCVQLVGLQAVLMSLAFKLSYTVDSIGVSIHITDSQGPTEFTDLPQAIHSRRSPETSRAPGLVLFMLQQADSPLPPAGAAAMGGAGP